MSSAAEHAQQQPFSSWAAVRTVHQQGSRPKLSLPNKVTLSNGGLLSLKNSSQVITEKSSPSSSSLPFSFYHLPHGHHRKSQRHGLTRFPVQVKQRPLDLVEKELGVISCAQLTQTLEDWRPQHTKQVKLPPMDYEHLDGYQNKSLDPSEKLSTIKNDFMNIYITPTSHQGSNQDCKKPRKHHSLPNYQFSPTFRGGTHRPSLAPASLEAATAQKLEPINTMTVVRGQGLVTHKNKRQSLLFPKKTPAPKIYRKSLF